MTKHRLGFIEFYSCGLPKTKDKWFSKWQSFVFRVSSSDSIRLCRGFPKSHSYLVGDDSNRWVSPRQEAIREFHVQLFSAGNKPKRRWKGQVLICRKDTVAPIWSPYVAVIDFWVCWAFAILVSNRKSQSFFVFDYLLTLLYIIPSLLPSIIPRSLPPDVTDNGCH